MAHMANQAGLNNTIFDAVERRNESQQLVLIDKILAQFGNIKGMTFALWGLAFKPDTDDIRSAPAIRMAQVLTESGANVRVYDPQAMEVTKALLGTECIT